VRLAISRPVDAGGAARAAASIAELP